MEQIAIGTQGVSLKDYYTPKYPRAVGLKKGGKVDFSQIVRNKKTGVLSMKKATSGTALKKKK